MQTDIFDDNLGKSTSNKIVNPSSIFGERLIKVMNL